MAEVDEAPTWVFVGTDQVPEGARCVICERHEVFHTPWCAVRWTQGHHSKLLCTACMVCVEAYTPAQASEFLAANQPFPTEGEWWTDDDEDEDSDNDINQGGDAGYGYVDADDDVLDVDGDGNGGDDDGNGDGNGGDVDGDGNGVEVIDILDFDQQLESIMSSGVLYYPATSLHASGEPVPCCLCHNLLSGSLCGLALPEQEQEGASVVLCMECANLTEWVASGADFSSDDDNDEEEEDGDGDGAGAATGQGCP